MHSFWSLEWHISFLCNLFLQEYMNKYDLILNIMYKICINTNHRGRSSPRALWVNESKALPIDNMCIHICQKYRNYTIYLWSWKKFPIWRKKESLYAQWHHRNPCWILNLLHVLTSCLVIIVYEVKWAINTLRHTCFKD